MTESDRQQQRLMLDGLHAALQAKVAKLFEVYSSGASVDENADVRFRRGLDKLAEDHENACAYVEQMFEFGDEPVEV